MTIISGNRWKEKKSFQEKEKMKIIKVITFKGSIEKQVSFLK